MILIEDILHLHDLSVKDFGGSKGLRDFGSLESAIARPFQTFGGQELYVSVLEKSAALIQSIISNHPFVDGNKRTGFLAMATFLLENSIELTAIKEEAYNFTIKISTGEAGFDEIVSWLQQNTSAL